MQRLATLPPSLVVLHGSVSKVGSEGAVWETRQASTECTCNISNTWKVSSATPVADKHLTRNSCTAIHMRSKCTFETFTYSFKTSAKKGRRLAAIFILKEIIIPTDLNYLDGGNCYILASISNPWLQTDQTTNYSTLFPIFLLRGMENSHISGFTSKTSLSNTYFP